MSITHTISDFNDCSETSNNEAYSKAMAELEAELAIGLEDVKAGRVSPADEAFARIYEIINERKKKNK